MDRVRLWQFYFLTFVHIWLHGNASGQVSTLFFFLSDDTPHVPNEDLGEQAVLTIISNLTYIIHQVFPCKYTGFLLSKEKNKT